MTMSPTRIKICGLTRVRDVRDVVAAGADAVGFVFTRSPRRITCEQARRLVAQVPADVLRIGLFLDQQRSFIENVVNSVSLDMLQFHGSEPETDCTPFGLPYLKAVAMADDQSALKAEQDFPAAAGLLLDSHGVGERGGSGRVFDWSLSRPLTKPVWLAGGLNAENVAQAIRVVRPYAVDVSTGVESGPGIKDANLVSDFITAVRQHKSDEPNSNREVFK